MNADQAAAQATREDPARALTDLVVLIASVAVRVQGRELLASAANDRTVRIWDPATGMMVAEIPTSAAALAVRSFDSGALYVGLESGVLPVQASGPRRGHRNQ